MKGLDRAVVCEQVEHSQQEEEAPGPVDVPGEKREDGEVDEQSSQVDLKRN